MTLADAKRKIAESYKAFEKLIRKRIKELKPDADDKLRFKALLGKHPIAGGLRMSDLAARKVFADSIVDEVTQFEKEASNRSFYHITLLADEGIMSDRTPKFCLRLLKQKAHRALRRAELQGVFVVEIQPLLNWPQKGEGRTLLAHIHALVWIESGSDGDSVASIRQALGDGKGNTKRSWSCQFGARPIVIKSLTPQRGDPAYWAAYILKGLTDAKSRLPRKGRDAGEGKSAFKFRNTTEGLRPELALRVFELFSRLPIFAMVGGVGEGASVVGRCKNRLSLWSVERQLHWKSKGKTSVPAFDQSAFWQRSHKKRRSVYKPYFIDGPTIRD
ncbi:MAG: hypothetical protein V4647_05625 [Pseudomonadota bacterium]